MGPNRRSADEESLRATTHVLHEPIFRAMSSRIEPRRRATKQRSAGQTDFRKFARRCSGAEIGMAKKVVVAATLYRKQAAIAKYIPVRGDNLT
jgi:hypothetical protein